MSHLPLYLLRGTGVVSIHICAGESLDWHAGQLAILQRDILLFVALLAVRVRLSTAIEALVMEEW